MSAMPAPKKKRAAADADAAGRPSKKSRVADAAEATDGRVGKKDKASKKEKRDEGERREKKAKRDKTSRPDKTDRTEETDEADKTQKAAEKPEPDAPPTEKQAAPTDKEAKQARKQARREARRRLEHAEDQQHEQPRGGYVQTLSLSSVPQADMDAFLATHAIAVSDPRRTALRPVTAFEHLPSTNLLEKRPSPLAAFAAPTPIQAASWPFVLSGRDVVGVAETGSGKTMAFALPCVEAVSAAVGAAARPPESPAAVVVSPTRELAMQTHAQLARLAALVCLRCVCLYGGASKDDQRALLRRGAHVVVATPGRLKDFMADATVDLAAARFVVLDEADRMLDKGFEDDVRHILASCPDRSARQTLMFTATWPQSVQALAATFMVDPVKVTIGAGGDDDGAGGVELQANARIAQTVEVVDGRDKEGRLLQILRQRQQGARCDDRILVFCLYKKEATRIEAMLSRKGVRVAGIHGDLRQEQRTRSLEAFRSGATPVLVATDVAARGLDIPEVKLVINVTFPLTIEDYVHRIGRTGRAGNTGEAITLFTVQDKAHSGSLVNILKGAGQPVPEDLLKFGTTVKKKTHDMYGSFFKDVDMSQKATKITFD